MRVAGLTDEADAAGLQVRLAAEIVVQGAVRGSGSSR